jgi:hypothetical protein
MPFLNLSDDQLTARRLMVSPPAISVTQVVSTRRFFSLTLRLLLCPPKYPYGHIDTLYGIEWVPHIAYTSLTLERFKRTTLVSLLLSLCSSSFMGRHNPRCLCNSRSMGSRPHDATALCPRPCPSAEGVSSPSLAQHVSQMALRLYAS